MIFTWLIESIFLGKALHLDLMVLGKAIHNGVH